MSTTSAVHRFRDFELLVAERRLQRAGEVLPLGARAFDVLLALVRGGGGLVTKDDLLQQAWPGLVVEEANVHVQVSQLRKLLGADAIATVAGLGYRFAWPLGGAAGAGGGAAAPPPLPAERTPFVGREAALAEAARALAATRLLTLVGIGGTGKTRLALRLAAREQHAFPDGAAWADLAPLSDAAGLVPSIAEAFGCVLAGDAPPVQALGAALRERRALLVLDNCEHLLDGVAALADTLLAAAAGLKLMATSREALGLAGETTLAVRPLELPPPGAAPAEVLGSEAVRLFAERAAHAAPSLDLSEAATVALAAQICRRVDGIPLALELAAAQLKVIAPAQLLDLLQERFRLLVGSRRALARQQTLHAVIQWSHDHLAGDEQRLLWALSVCRGGCDLEAASALLGSMGGDSVARPALLSALTRLADLSLLGVSHTDPGAARYELLETVRHFALERLHASGAAAAVHERHAQHYLALAEAHDAEVMRAGEGAASLQRLAREHDNLMQALGWWQEAGDDEAAACALRLVVAMRHYWSARSLLRLGLALTTAVVQRAAAAGPGAGQRAPGRHLVWAYSALTQMHRLVGDEEGAWPWARRQLELAQALGDAEGLAIGHGLLGSLARDRGQLDVAEAELAASLQAAQTLGNGVRIADAQHSLATLALVGGRPEEALRRIEEVVTLRRQQGHAFKLSAALTLAAGLAVRVGRLTAARAHIVEAAALQPRIGSHALEVFVIDVGANLLARCARHERSAVLHRAVMAHMRAMELADQGDDEARRHAHLAAAREALGAEAFTAAMVEGEGLSRAVALQRLVRWLDELVLPAAQAATGGALVGEPQAAPGFRTF